MFCCLVLTSLSCGTIWSCVTLIYTCASCNLISYDGGGTRGHEGQGVGDKPEDDGLLKETFIKWASSNRTLT
jgi:hypothetical protein